VATVLGGVAVAALLPYTPLAGALGFTALPPVFLLVMIALVGAYLALVEGVKRLLTPLPVARGRKGIAGRRIHRRAARFTIRD
jgi:Mg2+-importing ATPase